MSRRDSEGWALLIVVRIFIVAALVVVLYGILCAPEADAGTYDGWCPTCGCTQEQAIEGALDAECPLILRPVARQQCAARAATPCGWDRWTWEHAPGFALGDLYEVELWRSYRSSWEPSHSAPYVPGFLPMQTVVGAIGTSYKLRTRAVRPVPPYTAVWSPESPLHVVPEPDQLSLVVAGALALVGLALWRDRS